VGTSDAGPASLRTVASVTPSSMACEAPWTDVGRKGCAASPINAMRACFEIHCYQRQQLEGKFYSWKRISVDKFPI